MNSNHKETIEDYFKEDISYINIPNFIFISDNITNTNTNTNNNLLEDYEEESSFQIEQIINCLKYKHIISNKEEERESKDEIEESNKSIQKPIIENSEITNLINETNLIINTMNPTNSITNPIINTTNNILNTNTKTNTKTESYKHSISPDLEKILLESLYKLLPIFYSTTNSNISKKDHIIKDILVEALEYMYKNTNELNEKNNKNNKNPYIIPNDKIIETKLYYVFSFCIIYYTELNNIIGVETTIGIKISMKKNSYYLEYEYIGFECEYYRVKIKNYDENSESIWNTRNIRNTPNSPSKTIRIVDYLKEVNFNTKKIQVFSNVVFDEYKFICDYVMNNINSYFNNVQSNNYHYCNDEYYKYKKKTKNRNKNKTK